jgi:hypothetical protein
MTFKLWLEAQLAYDMRNLDNPDAGDPNWLTNDKKNKLRGLYAGPTPKKGMHELKVWWNQAVDRNFIQSVTTIHFGHADRIDKEIQGNKNDDLSCIGYINPPYKNNWVGNCGIIVKGHITLAGNSDLQSNQWVIRTRTGRRKYSEYYRDFIIDKNTFVPPSGRKYNEFLVANWSPIAVVVSGDNLDSSMTPQQLSQKYKLPLLDESGQRLA